MGSNELLFGYGINFNEVPLWQRRGIGLYWQEFEKLGYNPITKAEESATRTRLHIDYELPMKDAYDTFLNALLSA